MGILLGLTAALCWGIGDVLVTQSARRIGVPRLMIYFEGSGLFFVSLLLLFNPGTRGAQAGTWAAMLGLAALNCVGAFLLYRAFTVGSLALVSPLTSGYAVVTALLAFAAGERPPLVPLVGALLLIAGIVVVTRAQYGGNIKSLAGLPESLGVIVLFGIFYWAVGLITPLLGLLWPIFVLRATRVVFGLATKRGPGVGWSRIPWAYLLVASFLSTIAFMAFNRGIETTYTTVVVTLASLGSAITVVLARLTLHEDLVPAQWLGVGMILVGVVLVSR
jgi:drug/metabolite transporter (DMT)-like permease